MLTTIGFDADDTLWQNEAYFRLTQDRFADLLREELQAGNTAACLRNIDKIGQAARRMQELIGGMLDFARLGRSALRIGPISVDAMIREVMSS